MAFTFVANLKPYTFNRGRGIRRFDAYLLSVDFSGGELAKLAKEVVRGDARLCADNGNVDGIRALIRTFEARAGTLDAKRKQEESRLGSYARPGELSTELSNEYRSLAHAIRATAQDATPDEYVRAAVTRQAGLDATYAIGMEDFTIATLTGLSVEPEYSGLARSFYGDLNTRAVEFAVRTQEGEFGSPPTRVFAGVHALDYDQAVDAGRRVAEAGLDGIATGLVGALRDRNSVDFRVQDGEFVELGETTARPYLRVLEVATGLHVGYHQVTGRRPDFHALGVGAPILLPLLGLLGDAKAYTSTDSTAPIIDGWSGATISLYVDEPAPLKLRSERIAQSWLEGGRGWDCDCAYCRNFDEAHPSDIDAAQRWWTGAGRPRLKKGDLHRRGPLAPYLPFLAHHPDLDVRTAAGLARVGHNHSLLQRLESKIREALEHGDVGPLIAMVEDYLAFPGLARWRASARYALEVARGGRSRLEGDSVSGAASESSLAEPGAG